MRAIGYYEPTEITKETALVDIDLSEPVATGRDLLVAVHAISINPVDVKIRANAKPKSAPRILGWDAAGIVKAVGPEATLFKPGDRVFYAGALDRPGTNAQFHLVDERIVGGMPKTLDFAAAAALPLTAITAWEALFDRLDVSRGGVPGAANAIVIIGGAGGVGSIAIQLVRALSDLTVIATASRAESTDWVKSMGAHHVINHATAMAPQIAALGLGAPAFVLSTNNSEHHIDDIAEFIAPQGRFALIDDPTTLNVRALKGKSVSLHWEFMFTRSSLETADMEEQHELLSKLAKLVDDGQIQTTQTQILRPLNAETMRHAHALVETNSMIGKLVVTDWP